MYFIVTNEIIPVMSPETLPIIIKYGKNPNTKLLVIIAATHSCMIL